MRNEEQSAGREREKGSYVGKLAFEMLREYPQASENVGLELRQEVSADTSLGVGRPDGRNHQMGKENVKSEN